VWRAPVDDTGVSRRRGKATDGELDAEHSRHDGFFRGFGGDDDNVRDRRPPKKRRSRAGMVALAVVLIVILGGGAAGYHYYSLYKSRHSSYSGNGFGAVTVMVKQGDTLDSIGPQLVRLGVIAAVDPWAAFVQNKGGLQPGEFKLHKHMGPAQAYALLMNPKSRVNITVTIPDGMRYSKFLPLMAQKSGIPLSQFQAAIQNTAALGLPSYANGNAEGFLYPATYDILPGSTTALQILQKAVAQFNAEAASLNLVAAAQKAQFTPGQVITEASLLEAEVGPQYYAQVARVIDNRLNQGMKLQLDSTVSYATGVYSYNLTQSELNVNSPYNTFLHADLPPGPIDSPGAAAIQAALHPAPQNGDLYFVTVDKKGTTLFTSSYSQFLTWQAQAKAAGV
jgi:UPF0755 protein